jgi:FKBP-type peptidyl-prolyl cis-trans isomerase 2
MQVFCALRLEFSLFLAPQVLDANHPLAGKGLVLKMTLMDITNLSNCNVDSLSFEEDC